MTMDDRRREIEGPPWGSYVDPDEAYVRGQTRQLGSGLLGGWSEATYGGSLEAPHGDEDEIKQTVAELVNSKRDS
jgi:hypothetical protein